MSRAMAQYVSEYIQFRVQEWLAHPDRTEVQLASLLGVSKATISNVRNGKIGAGWKMVAGYANAFAKGDEGQVIADARTWQNEREMRKSGLLPVVKRAAKTLG